MSATRAKTVPGKAPQKLPRQVQPASPSLPPAFDWLVYVNHPANSDLRQFDAAEARHHYDTFGRNEGRVCGEIDGREAFLDLIPPNTSVLEIGPYCTPLLTRRTHKVRYLDAFPTKELRKRVAEWDWGRPDMVPEIDFVWRGEPYAKLIDVRFEAVFSSHNIEHQPCLVTHLNDVASVLLPGHRLFLIIPDRRYCFDHYLPNSTIADVLDAFIERRRRHSARSVLEHRLLLTHNEAGAHWNGDHGADPRQRAVDSEIVSRITDSLKTLARRNAYVDTHAWQFVPESFAHIITTLNAAGLTRFEVERIYPTLRFTNEFFAVLRLPSVERAA